MMRFRQHDLGYQQRGSIAEVKLSGTEANVQLLDGINLQRYKASQRYDYYGGHFKKSPARIPIPRAGTWYVVVDLGGFSGQVSSSARVIP